jgi:hypothetical protein
MEIFWLVILIINIILYGGCIFGLLRRSSYTCISIRSPKLLILNNMGNFFMSIIIILSNFLDKGQDGKKYVSIFYYLTNFLMIIPFCFRFQRIVKCCEMQKDEREDLQELYSKRYLYLENHYIKLTLIIFAVLTLIFIISDIVIIKKSNEVFTANFLFKNIDKDIWIKIKSILWQTINFIEHMILLTYAYKICVNQLKQKLRFEIISCFIIWFLYSNAITILEIFNIDLNDIFIIGLSLGVCYLFLLINAVLPILISCSYRYSTIYHFTPKLMNNLYLFLSNESCYKEFSNYLNTINGNGRRYLTIYTQIMNYKLGFILKVDNEEGFLEANEIRNAYFNNANMDGLFPNEVINKVKNECEGLNNNHFTDSMFDEALQHCFNELAKCFNDFRRTEKFKELYEDFYFTSYIQCKMCNVGLINRF